jgi:competence protein ComEC
MHRWLKKRIHVSWFIAWISLGFLVGVALSIFSWSSTFTDSAWLVISLAIFIIALIKRITALLVLALLAGLVFGLWRGSIERQALVNYEPYFGKTVSLNGKVSEDPSYGPHGDQRMRVSQVKINNKDLPEEAWVSSNMKLEIKRGDLVKFEGKLNKGFGNIPASMFQAKLTRIERRYPGDIGRRMRDKFADAIRIAIPEPQASLGVGYLVGQRSALPENLDNQIKVVGLTHAVVASGYNLTILVAFAAGVFAKKSKYLAALASGLMITGFILITGFSPSMSRAGLVAGLGLIAWYYGRKIHPFIILPFAASITVLLHPAYIWGDIGWYLSFTAFVGVLILAPLLHDYFWGLSKKPHKIRQLFVETTAAQLATAPIILFIFHQYSPYALLANLLVLPLVPLAMLFTFIAGLAGIIVPTFAVWVAMPANAALSYSTHAISYVASLPNAKKEFIISGNIMVASYVLLVLLVIFMKYKTKHNFRQDNSSIKNNEQIPINEHTDHKFSLPAQQV